MTTYGYDDHLPEIFALGLLNADNQLTLWGSQGFLYDLNGNMTADGQNAYTWNVRNQLVALTPDGGTADTFAYDAFGRRQKKVINGTVSAQLLPMIRKIGPTATAS
jgi:YD repeat-containing protein